MIFSKKRTILYITKEKIRWAKGTVPDGKIYDRRELPWSEKNLQTALADIAEHFPKKLRVVVGEEFSYVTHFLKSEKPGRIISDAQVFIPENLQDGWDSKDGDLNSVQIMVVQQKLFSILKKMFFKAKLRVEAIESESISISRMIAAEKNKTVLAARYDGKILLEAARNGMVLATKIFYGLPEKEKVQEFLDYAANQKDISFDAIYIQDKTGDLIKIFQLFNLNIQEKELDPMIGICRKKDINGRDKDILNIFLGKAEGEDNVNIKGKKRLALREKIILTVFLVVVLAGAGAIYYAYKSQRGMFKKNVPASREAQKNQPGLQWEK